MVLPRPTEIWSNGWITFLYESCQTSMKFVDNTSPIVDEKYGHCLQRGREVIIETMMGLIMDRGYFKPQMGLNTDLLFWRDAPEVLAKFVQHLEIVLIGDKDVKIREKILAPVVGVATSTAAIAPLPKPTKDWSENEIKTLYEDCQSAMKLLESSSSIISEKYRQCLQTGGGAIIENMMKAIMDINYFRMEGSPASYLLYWQRAPQIFVMFLQNLETVFTGDNEVRLASKKQQAMPPIASLVAFVEAPDPRLKSGVWRTYGEIKLFSVDMTVQLEFLQGKRLLNEKWAEEDETYELSGEAIAMLCMHLWSLMRYVGFSKPDKIWEAISKGWPECVSWEEGHYGQFWQIICVDKVPLRVQAENKGLKSMLDAYKDMEKYFKGDDQHFLINWPTAYYPEEENPIPDS